MSGATSSTDDNPCWGGPEPNRHDLEYLLRVLGSTTENGVADGGGTSPIPPTNLTFSSSEEHSALIQRIHEKLILYQDQNYIAIHKPADLRMDGQFRTSVHKLLLYLFPPPSLLQMVSDGMTTEDKSNSEEATRMKYHQQLLKSIDPLSNHSFLKDDPHKMVHQLDYATSGVLLVGKSRKATAVASRSFEERKTNKQYVAVVINPASSASNNPPLGADFFEHLTVMPSSSLDSWGDGSLEKRYRKKRQRDMDEREGKRGTFDGYMPVHSVFDKWRGSLLREKKKREAMQQNEQMNTDQTTAVADEKGKRKKRDFLPALPSPKVALTSQDIDELLSLPSSWKAVKSHCANGNSNWTTIVETMTTEYNQSLAEFHAKKLLGQEVLKDGRGYEGDKNKHAHANLPPLFRIQNDDKNDTKENGNDSGSSQDPNTFYMCASIGEPNDGRFFVVVDPSAVCEGSVNTALVSSPLPELRPSLTKCTVLWRGYMDATDGRIPVTKVLLQPWTGRRHQLRVHLAHVAGCPILGDATYGGNLNADEESNERGAVCRRMCLHAKELSIPLIGNESKTFVAPDPFVTTKKNGCGDESLVIL